MTRKRKVVCKIAHTVAWQICETCGAPHIFLFDENADEPFAEASLDLEMMMEMSKEYEERLEHGQHTRLQ